MPGPLGATITTTAFQHRKAKSMNNTDLAEKIAAEQGITKADARKIVDAVFAGIGEAAAKGEEIALNGFGKFKIKDSPTGRPEPGHWRAHDHQGIAEAWLFGREGPERQTQPLSRPGHCPVQPKASEPCRCCGGDGRTAPARRKLGRASCRERVCQYV